MQNVAGKYIPVIGLEVHAQLLTSSKIFCACSTEFGSEPNSNVCPVCLGHPGVLPVLNRKAVDYIIMMGFAAGSRINNLTYFARKNYFYPDLPKGYQISQFERPFCEGGGIAIESDSEYGEKKTIRVRRIHLEEDAGKLIHFREGTSAADLNRCGVPLIEIVSEPDISSPGEAFLYLSKIKQILKYLRICDCNMEEGSLRCDANISLKHSDSSELGVKTELKNMNSFRNVEKALEAEIERQKDLLESGKKIKQETLLWDVDSETIKSMRSKEEAHDYRYFPEPDLVGVNMSFNEIEELRSLMPELPEMKKAKFLSVYGLPVYDAEVLTSERDIAEYFESSAELTKDYKALSNWVMTDIMGVMDEDKKGRISFPVRAEDLAKLINLINSGEINQRIAKDVFSVMLKDKISPARIISEKNLKQVTDKGAIGELIDKILSENPREVEEYISGKEKVFGYFIGKIMRVSGGKANPAIVNEILHKKLDLIKTNKLQE